MNKKEMAFLEGAVTVVVTCVGVWQLLVVVTLVRGIDEVIAAFVRML